MRRIYAWEDWFGRARTVLRRGVDYHCSQSTMVQMVRSRASERGLRVRLVDIGVGVVIEVLGLRGEVGVGTIPHTDTTTVAT